MIRSMLHNSELQPTGDDATDNVLVCAAQALAALFMMNNEHFMVKTVEGSEALMLLGPDWLERQKDKVCFVPP